MADEVVGPFAVSAKTGEGVEELVQAAVRAVRAARQRDNARSND